MVNPSETPGKWAGITLALELASKNYIFQQKLAENHPIFAQWPSGGTWSLFLGGPPFPWLAPSCFEHPAGPLVEDRVVHHEFFMENDTFG